MHTSLSLSPGSQKRPQGRPLMRETSLAGPSAFEAGPTLGAWASSLLDSDAGGARLA
jgi:hypothetical protein